MGRLDLARGHAPNSDLRALVEIKLLNVVSLVISFHQNK